jgi:hypothetical protein
MSSTLCISESPKGQGSCPRLNGLHKDSKGCGRFYKCENGTVVTDKCSEGYEFDDHTKLCRLATPQELEKCSRPSNSSGMMYLGFYFVLILVRITYPFSVSASI